MREGKMVRYEVRDIGLAAYFMLRGFKLVTYFVDNKRRVNFVFEGDPNQLRMAEEDYRMMKEESKVPARQFYETYMNIRSLAISLARQVEETVRHHRNSVFD